MSYNRLSRTAYRQRHLLAGTSVAALALAASLGSANAQQQDQSAPETVIVSGSRISTPGFTAPTPVTSLSADFLQTQQIDQERDLEYQIPSLSPNQVAQTQQAAGGSAGESTFNLRGLGGDRTLTLLNGLRIMPSDYSGNTDANLIPTSLITRVDTVTGGASAAYGSDAVAGVVNVILDNNFEGFKGSASGGEDQYHDDKTIDTWLTWGSSFAGGKGHFVINGEIYSDSGCNWCVANRPWAAAGWITVTNPLYKAGVANGQPNYVNFNNETFSALSSGGTITSGPLKGTQFLANGTPTNIQYGNYVGSMFMQGGSGDPFWQYGTIDPSVGRQSLYSHISYDIDSDLTVWGQLLMAHTDSVGGSTPNYSAGDITITNQNPYLPSSIVTQMAADKITSFALGRTNVDIPSNDLQYGAAGTPAGDLNVQVNRNDYILWSTGLNGKSNFFGTPWTWDLTGQYNANSYWAIAPDNRIQSNWQAAIDSIPNPAVGGVAGVPVGTPVCRASLPSELGKYVIPGQTAAASPQPSPGCVPIDIFGTGNITQKQADYFLTTSWNWFPMEAWDIVGNIQGVPLKDWAGDVSVASGFEVRRNSIHGYSDPGSLLKEYRFNNIQPFTGSEQSEEGYVEASIPLIKDFPLIEDLNTDSAFRYTNYSQSGGVETYKAGLNWSVNDDIRLRYTYSRDIRAPNLAELFSPVAQNFSQVTDLAFNPPQLYSSAQGTGGNPNLKPEVGYTNTAGIVYSPSWLPGLNVSVDAWELHLHDAIIAAGAQTVINNCYLYGVTSFCSDLTRSPTTGLIVNVSAIAYNVAVIQTQGIDYEGSYSFPASSLDGLFAPFGNVDLDGEFGLRVLASFQDKYVTIQPGSVQNTVNNKWRGTATLTWNNDVTRIALNMRLVGAGTINPLYTQCGDSCVGGVVNSINNNTVGGRYYFNLSAEHTIPGYPDWRVFGVVNNIFNVAPPDAANGIFIPQTSPGVLYDNIGRTYTVGVKFAF